MTPEEKLFAVIQRGGKGATLVATKRLRLSLPHITLTHLNRALYAILGVLVLANVLLPLLWRPSVERVTDAAVQHIEPVAYDPPLAGLKPAEAYVQAFNEHNPFQVQAPAPVTTALTPATSPHYADVLKQEFRLVGISWGPEPVAMIEQISQQRTYVVKSGDALPPFTVKAIMPDRVVLSVDSQELELF